MPNTFSSGHEDATSALLDYRQGNTAQQGYDAADAGPDVMLPSLAEGSAETTALNGQSELPTTDGATANSSKSQFESRPLIRLTRERAPQRRFEVLQQWEGVVTDIDGDVVWAELHDLSDDSNPHEMVEFPLKEIPEDDQSLLEPGCVFYWIVGYEYRSGGQISRTSEIRVRRTPEWTSRSVDQIEEKAEELFSQMVSNGEDGSSK